MEIHKITISHYKQLRNFQLAFSANDRSLSELAIKFLIGENGSGKSSLIEAIGLIFTRALHDESPGFEYELTYSVFDNKGKRVYVYLTNQKKKKLTYRLQVRTHPEFDKVDRAGIRDYRFSEQTELHPNKILSFASGPNNELEDVLYHSALKSLHSDMYDEMNNGQEATIDHLESLGASFVYEPNFLNFDNRSAIFILLALVSSVPDRPQFRKAYLAKRQKLLDNVPGFNPLGFSVTVDEMTIDKLLLGRPGVVLKKWPRYLSLFRQWLGKAWEQSSVAIRHSSDGQPPRVQRTFYFSLSKEHAAEDGYGLLDNCPPEDLHRAPLEFLNMLMVAYRSGYIADAHLQYTVTGSDHVLDDGELSDGEWLWLCRMGLVLLVQQENIDNVLFLFDEPDVFLNESWTMQFVEELYRLGKVPKFNGSEYRDGFMNHEYFIATHSTLLLTDAMKSQTYVFHKLLNEQNGVTIEAEQVNMSTFAADRTEISARLFTKRNRTGKYARQKINQAIKSKSIDDLDRLIAEVGPGYDRFRLEHMRISLQSEEEGESSDAN